MSNNYPDFYDNDYDEVCKIFVVLKLNLHPTLTLEFNTGMDIDGSGWMDNKVGF